MLVVVAENIPAAADILDGELAVLPVVVAEGILGWELAVLPAVVAEGILGGELAMLPAVAVEGTLDDEIPAGVVKRIPVVLAELIQIRSRHRTRGPDYNY
jgi:hypothetical protein